MLVHLSVNNFAIVKSLQIELCSGMTTITGETGAGKSIAIDALGLCLGSRSDSSMVRQGEDKVDLCASFIIEKNISAQRWLEDNELFDGDECILRRIIGKDGRSRAFINGNPVPVSQLKSLGQTLVSIHGQHAHHQLLKKEYQLSLLDQYAGHQNLINHVQKHYQTWRQADNLLKQTIQNGQQNLAQKQLLEYQIKELDELALLENEFVQLEQEHKRLSNSGELLSLTQQSLDIINDNDDVNAIDLLQCAIHQTQQLSELDSNLGSINQMLNEAVIHLEEANSELRHYLDSIDMDPMRMQAVEERYSKVMSLSKKHLVLPEDLYQHHQDLAKQIELLDCSDERIEQLQSAVDKALSQYVKSSEKLSKSRKRYAKELNKLISASMHQLSMEKAQFDISINSDIKYTSPLGIDDVEYLVSANPGQPLQPLGKVASGGELSRISLAIQVITAQKVETPSLIFDEVDVGISGPTAAVVGKMLRKLGESTQILCVTHLPQVAGNGHQQMFVAKKTKSGTTETQMFTLNEKQRIEELARLLGGSEITSSTLANAKELMAA
ncbi:DNA repair protein RecN [Vibrio sp. UCD-FRSSP16_10]|uniref:DNA repair protein RecN n=1 Tax=unclassified Vibrio TaxID=2614977 RepID=UPI0008020501|nr:MULTISPECIES: DNA repair protein RecN [unclassified Vibrio]OBT16821.1 DNA repair protein RecN [Vibrio sp. UCD-FRSSP16_30]OBT21807.1 DNA repair protein RecN [Vibrio sp. UCD-FRSSP16_10]